ncbi:MAG TPA: cellulose synthase family protein [Terriglobales bacterium]|nr:cellulose synthase family protein [Terriglobales bacterium]
MHPLFAMGLAMAPAENPLLHYVRTQLLNRTFTLGPANLPLYQANGFDMALLIPYFTVLAILAFYGFHRYALVFLYYRHRHRRTLEPRRQFEQLPRVTVQLPIYNEQYVVERLVESICKLEYPRDRLEIQLLDDSTDETCAVGRAAVDRLAAQGHPIVYLHRTNRQGFKAGALEEGMHAATGEFIAIFDADFVPPHDFLLRTIHYFTDPKLGMVQTRWGYINRDYSWLTQVEAILLDGHFVMEHGGRHRADLFFNFNGTAGMWRRKAIEEAGGWEHDTLTEDTDLSYRSQLAGWKFIYLPQVECPSELPVDMNAFKVQQARWAKGLIQVSKKILPRLFRRKDVDLHHKVEAWCHLTANISYPLMIVLCTLLLPAMIVRFYQGWFQMLYIDLPLFIASTCSISSFYVASQRELFPRAWYKTLLYMPMVMAIGIGLTVTNTRAVLEALLGIKTSFKRTPKFRIESKADGRASLAQKKKYRRKIGWSPLIELALGTVFAAVTVYAFQMENYLTIPFLLLFVVGYWTTGLLSLFQGRMPRRHRSAPTPASQPSDPSPTVA